jgi:hypothetical protein
MIGYIGQTLGVRPVSTIEDLLASRTSPGVVIQDGSIWQWNGSTTINTHQNPVNAWYIAAPDAAAPGAWVRNRKVFTTSDWNETPVEDYVEIEEGSQVRYRWINTAGYQEKNTDGGHSGARPAGKIPPGQDRLSRTGLYQFVLHGSHSGMGDGYNLLILMGVTAHSETNLVTKWGGQNSGGLIGGQVSAVTAKVNLYLAGDMVMKDAGFQDVAQLGYTTFLYNEGGNSGDYLIPRYGYLTGSRNLECGAIHIGLGPFKYGFDLSGMTSSTNFFIVLPQNARIGFNAATSADEDFLTTDPGTVYLAYDGAALNSVVGGQAIQKLASNRATYTVAANNADIVRIFAVSTSAYLAFGQIDLLSYISAVSNGTDNTQLVFRTAAAGTEAEVARFNHFRAFIQQPPSSAQTLSTNGQVTMEFTNDTTLTFRGRGSDGTTRTGTITIS